MRFSQARAYILAFLLLLVVPLGIHWIHGSVESRSPSAEDRLVIITPNDTDIRNEFKWAFSDWHLQKYGQRVDIEYLSPGGTSDIKRELETIYRKIETDHGGTLPAKDAITVGIDMVWGGGDVFFDRELKPLGILAPIDLNAKTITQIFPQPTLAGVKLYDQTKNESGNRLAPQWVGTCLSSFGIVYNPDLYLTLHLAPPATWSDLADPALAGAVALADPTHSGTAGMTFMMVLQCAMGDAENDFFAQPENKSISKDTLRKTASYQVALDNGWKRGMAQLELIAANARYFSDDARQSPSDVASGDAAVGTAIDFYGRVTEESVGPHRLQFVTPANATAVTPDPIAILYGAHGRQLELANHFIEFLLSPHGQRLWILKAGQPGGPRLRALRRAPIRRDAYHDQTGWTDNINYFTQTNGFTLRQEWMSTFSDLRTIWAAAWIDSRDQLKDSYAKVLAVPDKIRRQHLLARLGDIPLTRQDVADLMAVRKRIEADPAQDADQWHARERMNLSSRFRAHYRQVSLEAQR
ncbi:MAG: extracellular solute-binding protein [Planctomycetota bacterium]|nr:extracellular solute-binding protein [Planctomycetota bacterium]